MSKKDQIRALTERVDALTRENDARIKAAARASCKHPKAVWSRAVIGTPESFSGRPMTTFNWKCDDCGQSRGGNIQTIADDWPDWVRVRLGLTARHPEGVAR